MSSSPVLRGRPPPRLFCDICDVFDQHDTDDCPLQAGELDELAIHSAYHADRQAERPYCDTCEGDCASGAWVWVPSLLHDSHYCTSLPPQPLATGPRSALMML